MKFHVAKPFNTHLQRFAIGAPVAPTDSLAPFDFDGLRDRKWIAAERSLDEAPEVETPPEDAAPAPPGRSARRSS